MEEESEHHQSGSILPVCDSIFSLIPGSWCWGQSCRWSRSLPPPPDTARTNMHPDKAWNLWVWDGGWSAQAGLSLYWSLQEHMSTSVETETPNSSHHHDNKLLCFSPTHLFGLRRLSPVRQSKSGSGSPEYHRTGCVACAPLCHSSALPPCLHWANWSW